MPLAWPERREAPFARHGPMDQKAVATTPTTSAWAASASMVLATVSNIRMVRSPPAE